MGNRKQVEINYNKPERSYRIERVFSHIPSRPHRGWGSVLEEQRVLRV